VSFIETLKNRWKVKSGTQVLLILLVFACTGCSIIPIKHLMGINASTPAGYMILFYIGVLPIYNIMLLGYGFIFGQFKFFLEFEKRFFNRIINAFKPRK
jgi:hypothetical protein